MSQLLQISIPLTGSDTALKADSALSDAEVAEQGLIFGEMLGDMVQPAKKGPGHATLRQLPAGISLLSGVSQAMQAGDADNTAQALAQSDITLLAASLLGQIALKDSSAAVSDADSESAQLTAAEGAAMAEGEPKVGGEANAQDSSVVLSSDLISASTDKTIAVQTDAVSAAQVGTEADEKHLSEADSVDSGKTNHQGEKHSTIAPGTLKQELTPAEKGMDGVVAGKLTTKQDAGALQRQEQAALTAQVDAEGVAEAEAQDSVGMVTTTAHKLAETSADNIRQQPAKPEQSLVTATPVPAQVAEQITAQAHVALNSADKAVPQDADEKATSAELIRADKAAAKVTAELGAATAKHSGSEQQAQQQNPRQNSASPPLPDAQQLVSELQAGAGKISSDAATTNRADALFGNALQGAELRQQSQVSHSSAKTMAEQLKQSLNLQQQDAAGQLRERVSLMVRQNIQVAEIRLDPAGLGQMQIKIDMQQEQASVQFVVQQPQAKELLEQQLPRLRELLQQQGIVLSEGNVQQQSQQQERQLAQRQQEGGSGRPPQHGEEAAASDTAGSVQVTTRLSERLVDYYA
jgi:flagellar hook-length control protein FliK